MTIKILVIKSLRDEIYKKFKKDSLKVYNLINSLRDNLNKGKHLGKISTFILKELKYKNFRFYFIIKENELILYRKEDIKELLIKFIDMSNKNKQQQTINKIKIILKNLN